MNETTTAGNPSNRNDAAGLNVPPSPSTALADDAPRKAPWNFPAVIMFAVSTLAVLTVFPWYGLTWGFGAGAWVCGCLVMGAAGLSITGGYHRLWAHRAYEAHWSLRLFFMLFGAMALQNSILNWASQHRIHHRWVDDPERDPYSIQRGFWFAHIGWMLKDYPAAETDFSNARDLQADPLVRFQHRHYLAIALGMNFGLPLALGWVFGDPWAFLLVAGLLRLVVNHHLTFFINSLAHWWGRRPYTVANTARDNDLVALFTYGEGYHNYHHLFQWDYRNGVRWWQFDPTKWLIASLSWAGVTRNLRRVPEFKIQRAMLLRQFERVKARLRAQAQQAVSLQPGRLEVLQSLLEQELRAFSATLAEWQQLQAERIDGARRQLVDQWRNSDARRRLCVLEETLRLQRRRVRLLCLQTACA